MNIIFNEIDSVATKTPGVYFVTTTNSISTYADEFYKIYKEKYENCIDIDGPHITFYNEKTTIIFVNIIYIQRCMAINTSGTISSIFSIDVSETDLKSLQNVIRFTTKPKPLRIREPVVPPVVTVDISKEDSEFLDLVEWIKINRALPSEKSSFTCHYNVLRLNKLGKTSDGIRLTPTQDKFLTQFLKTPDWGLLTRKPFEGNIELWENPNVNFIDYKFSSSALSRLVGGVKPPVYHSIEKRKFSILHINEDTDEISTSEEEIIIYPTKKKRGRPKVDSQSLVRLSPL